LKLRDLLIVGALVLLGGLAAADTFLGGDSPSPKGADSDRRTTTEDRSSTIPLRERFPPVRTPGIVLFLDGERCRLRQAAASSGDELPLEPINTACDLWAPTRGVRIAYRVGGSVAESVPFRFLDLNHTRVDLGGWRALFGEIAWSPDGQRAAWCETTEVGFDYEVGSRDGPLVTRGCPREYTGEGVPVFLSGRRVLAGEPPELLFAATGRVSLVHRGSDGSYAVLVDGKRIERYEGSRLSHVRPVRPSVVGSRLEFSPDNCAVLANREGVVALVDLGCFRGADAVTTVSPDNCVNRSEATKSECARYPAPHAFEGTAAAWSPNGEWIAVAQANALAFHRVVGRYRVIRWPAEPHAVAWLR
jgi:WD40-like Beta Propeller Repeat